MITSDTQLHQAQTDIQFLWCFLEAALATHARLDYQRRAAPYLLQLQERQQKVIGTLHNRLYRSVLRLCNDEARPLP